MNENVVDDEYVMEGFARSNVPITVDSRQEFDQAVEDGKNIFREWLQTHDEQIIARALDRNA